MVAWGKDITCHEMLALNCSRNEIIPGDAVFRELHRFKKVRTMFSGEDMTFFLPTLEILQHSREYLQVFCALINYNGVVRAERRHAAKSFRCSPEGVE